ncbi:MAG: glycosyltransferase [Treponema sp.]|nr:glycosyltransferase [Treponema sp.]
MRIPIISCIVPVYKVEQLLPQCIDSILAQSFTDFELILVDDGSPDNSGKICDEYAQKDSRIVVIHKENGGVSSARNAGLDKAKGEWICFVDSDDWIEKTFFENMYKTACVNSSELVICGLKIGKQEKYSEILCAEKDFCVKDKKEWLCVFSECRIRDDRYVALHSPCAKLYKKAIIENNRFDTSLKYAEDYRFNLFVYDKIKSVSFLRATMYFYYNNQDSVTRRFDISSSKNHFTTVDLTYDFVMKNKLGVNVAFSYAYDVVKHAIYSIFANYRNTGDINKDYYGVFLPYLSWKMIFCKKNNIKDILVFSLCKIHFWEVLKILFRVKKS